MPGTQTVRLYGSETATVTALLWLKGKRADASTFDYKLWFTDTYVRTRRAGCTRSARRRCACPPTVMGTFLFSDHRRALHFTIRG